MSYHTPSFEDLEPRLLLTTLFGSEVFEYQDANGEIVRIALEGNIVAELIAGDIDDTNAPYLGDMPGAITASDFGRTGVEILGGIGGEDGIEVIGDITNLPEGFSIYGLATSDALSNGETYGFTVIDEIDGIRRVRLAYLDVPTNSANVVASTEAYLQFATLKEDTTALSATLGATPHGFAVNPTSGETYCVYEDAGASSLVELSSITGEVLSTVAILDGVDPVLNIEAMAHDGTNLFIIGETNGTGGLNVYTVNEATGAATVVAAVSLDDIQFPVGTTMQFQNSITAMAFDSSGQAYVAAVVKDGENDSQYALMDLDTDAASADAGELSNLRYLDIEDSNLSIQGLTAYGTGFIGVDWSQEVDSQLVPRLVRIDVAGASAVNISVLSPAGQCENVYGLSSSSTGVLYAATTTHLLRGAVPHLSITNEGASRVEVIAASDFAPSAVNGLLYFVVRQTVTVGEEEVTREDLYTLDPSLPNMSAIQNSLQYVKTLSGTTSSIAWERSTAEAQTSTLYGYRVVDVAGTQRGQIYDLLGTNSSVYVTFQGEEVTDITGIEFPLDNTAAGETYAVAIRNSGSSSMLVRINMTSGVCYELGPLPDPDDTEAPITGENLQGLSWDPLRTNPFTNEVGVLLATDVTTGELVELDHRARFPTADTFALYISETDSNASISIARVPPVDEDSRPMQPFDGSVGQLRVYDAQNSGDLIVISAPGGTGEVYLGARTEDLNPDDDEDDLRPHVSGNLVDDLDALTALGVRAAGVNDFSDTIQTASAESASVVRIRTTHSHPDWSVGATTLRNHLGAAGLWSGTVSQVVSETEFLVNLAGGAGTPQDVIDGIGLGLWWMVDDIYGTGVYNNISSGMVVAENLLSYISTESALSDRLIEGNVDSVGEMVVLRNPADPTIPYLMIDIDGKDDTGALVGDQLVQVGDDGKYIAASALDVTDGTTGAALSGVGALALGDYSAADGWLAGNETLFAVYEINNPAPQTDIGGTIDLTSVALVIRRGGQMYTIRDNGGSFELWQIDRDDTGAVDTETFLGTIRIDDTDDVVNIQALAADSSGQLYIIGDNSNTGTSTLYRLGTTPVDVDLDGNDDVIATAVGAGTGVNQDVVGLAFDSSDTLFAVIDNGVKDTLYTVSTSTGLAAEYPAVGSGDVEVGGGGTTDVHGMAFLPDGTLVAVDYNGGADRIIAINLTDPSDSTELVAGIETGLLGYTADSAGLCYAINPDVADSSIYVSPGYTSMFGSIDTTTGVFTRGDYLQDGSGNALVGVKTMAFRSGPSSLQPTVDALYVIDGSDNLYEIDPTTGQAVSTNYSLEDPIGTAIAVESIAFDINKVLYGYDQTNGRLVDIDLGALQPAGSPAGTLDVGQTVRTTVGSLRPTCSGLAYDMANDQFLTVDNSTGQTVLSTESNAESSVLVALKGFASDSATAQNLNSTLVGGTVTGKVNVSGNIEDTFYAGWLVTGYTPGLAEGDLTVADNFFVGGDLRNLVSNSAVGTLDGTGLDAPTYVTGFDLDVTGKTGQVWALDSFVGAARAENTPTYLVTHDAAATTQNEIEYRTDEDDPEGTAFQAFELYRTGGAFFNDSFETAQYLGTMGVSTGLADGVIELSGSLGQNSSDGTDDLDFFGLSLLAGQTVTVQVVGVGVSLGVFDPDGRLIATDMSMVDLASVAHAEFRFTTDRPGVYRLALGGAPFDGSTSFDGDFLYTLSVSDAGNLALGAVKANNNIFNNNIVNATNPSFEVTYGDLGALSAGTFLFFDTLTNVATDILVSDGNLRTLEAASIGRIVDGDFSSDPEVSVPNGHVGLLKATGTGEEDLLAVDFNIDPIGGNFQLIDAAAGFRGNLTANGGLGVLRAGEMEDDNVDISFALNRDGVGDDGIIDLIDVEGDLGNLSGGGPSIDCGPNGDVRYLRVGGDIYQDSFFGLGQYDGVVLDPGQSEILEDDSGATLTLTPRHLTTDPFSGGAVDPRTRLPEDTEDLPFLTYRAYGVRGSGGSVLVDVTSTGGFSVTANAHGVSAPVAIGKVTVQGQGRRLVVDGDGDGYELEDQPSPFYNLDLKVAIGGNTTIDVFEVIGGNFTSITNYTGGEIVNVVADSIGMLYAYGSVGIAKSTFDVAVNPRQVLETTYGFIPADYPFVQQHVGIVVNGNVDAIYSRRAIGNIMVDGQIDGIIPNYNQAVNLNDAYFDGIAAPIFTTGDIASVNIGEGVAPSGSGEFAHAGVFSLGEIRNVFNTGANANIRGAVVGAQGVRNITLTNASIINADIIAGTLDSAIEYTGLVVSGDITRITTNGNGGIIGTLLCALNVDNITVNNGFGMFNSDVITVNGNGSIGNTTVDGFGIRLVEFSAGGDQGNITATGRGARSNTRDYSPTVRYSETETWMPGTDQLLSRLNDIHLFLGTSAADPMDREGLLEDIYAHGNRDLGAVSGYRITTNGGTTSESGLTSFDFANSIRGFRTYPIHASDTATNSIDSMEITTGKLGYFNPAQDVNNLDMTVAGLISNMIIRGSLLGTSSISILGPNGNLQNLRIFGQLQGNVTVEGIIGTITINGNMTGNITVAPTRNVRTALNRLTILGAYNGNLDVDGNVGTIDVRGQLGVTGDTLQINGNLGTLSVGTRNAGTDMALDLNVLGNVTNMTLYGAMSGDAWIDGNLRTLSIRNPGAPIDGDLTVMGTLTGATIIGGNWDSAMTVGNNIGTVQIIGANADLGVTGSITCLLGNINLVWIRGGDLLGTVSAPNGTINQIKVTGSDLGAASLIEAGQLNTLRVDGFILSGARIVIDNALGTLDVRRGVQAGSTINVGSMRNLKVRGDLAGDFTLGQSSGRLVIRVNGTLGSDGSVFKAESNVRMFVGNIADNATLWVTGNLTYLRATGAINGNVIVDGSISTLQAARLNSGVIVSGMDMNNIRIIGAVDNSLIQAGINRGDDGDFGTDDENGSQIPRMGQIRRIQVGATTLSIIAAGGHIINANVRGALTNSSISSGMVLDGGQIQNVLNGTNTMAAVADLNNLRGAAGAAVTLLWGNFNTAIVRGAMNTSALTAGIDPGADGVFANTDVVTTSLTGGNSSFRRIIANNAAATSVILADAGLGRRPRTGAAVTEGNITYNVLTDANVLNGAAIEALQGTAQAGTPVTFGGITVNVRGSGQVQVRHSGATAADIDTLVITGTNVRSRITITGGGSIGRILTADDTTAGTLTYNGTLLGNGNALWMDAGAIRTFSLGTLGAAVRGGRVGGNVTNLTLGTQGSGQLRIGGSVRTLRITNGDDSLLTTLGEVNANTTPAVMTIGTGTGATWVFDTDDGEIQRWDITADESGLNPDAAASVYTYLNTDAADPSAPRLITAMDWDFAGGDLLAVAEVWSLSPTVNLGAIGNSYLSLTGLGVVYDSGTETVYGVETAEMNPMTWNLGADYDDIVATAIDSNGVQFVIRDETAGGDGFRLYSVDSDDHTLTIVGTGDLNVGGTDILDIAAADLDSDGTLYFVGELDGSGEMSLFTLDLSDLATATDEATVVGALDGGAFTDGINALCLTSDETVLYAIRETAGVDILSRIDKTAATVTDIAAVQVGAVGTSINGMDVDAAGNLLALDHSGGEDKMIRLNLIDPTASWAVGDDEALLVAADGLSSTATGEFYTVDTNGGSNDRFLRSLGRDRLVRFSTTTGARAAVGYLQDFYGNYYYSDVYTLAGDGSGVLYAILKDGDGMGGAKDPTDGTALAQIGTTASGGNVRVSSDTSTVNPPRMLEDGGGLPVTEVFTAMAMDSGDTLYAVYRNGGQDFLVDIDTTGADPVVGAAQQVLVGAADTQIVGMGFDSLDNLVAYDLSGGAGLINLSDPTTHALDAGNSVRVTDADVLDPDIDAYALGRSGADGYRAYAYDYDNTIGGLFYESPGEVATLGTIETNPALPEFGYFTQRMPLASQLDGTGLTSDVLDVSFIDADNVYVLTADGNLYRDNEDGDLLADLGPVKDADTLETLSLTTFDYDSNAGATIAIDGNYNQLVTLETDMDDLSAIGALNITTGVDDQDFQDLTVTSGGVMYALRDEGGTFALYRVARNAGDEILGAVKVADLEDGGGNPILSVKGIEAAASSELVYFIGTTAAQQTLYSIDSAGTITEISDLTKLGAAFEYEVQALCFSGDTMYIVADNTDTTFDTLYRVNTGSGEVTEIGDPSGTFGRIQSGGVDVDILGMDAGSDGVIVALATDGAGDERTVRINTVDPSDSTDLSTAGATLDGYRGFAFDANNRFYMVLPVVGEDDQVARSNASATTPRMEPGSIDAVDVTDLTQDGANPGDFYTFSESLGTNGAFAQLTGTTQAEQFGITLGSVNRLFLGNGYAGRIVATGNTFRNVRVTGSFEGTLYTAGSIRRFTQTGNFSGTLYGGTSLGTITIRGALLDGGLLTTPGTLSNLRVTGAMNGGISAERSVRLTFGTVGTTADIQVNSSAGRVQTGLVSGAMEFGSVRYLRTGNLNTVGANSANIQVHGNASRVYLLGGTDAGTYLKVDGFTSYLRTNGIHRGTIAIDQGATTVQTAAITNGFLVIGENVRTLRVNGAVTSSVLSIGTTIGADGVYNTSDDRITGGALTNGTLRGNFYNSALVAGVLPNASYGSGLPAETWYYTGDDDAANLEDVDSAEVGGVLPSAIRRLTFFGETGNEVDDNISAIASESLGRITRRRPWSSVYTREYTDPISPPALEWSSTGVANDSEATFYFTEEINTASLILSVDTDDDGSVTGLTDVQGTVTVYDNDTGEVYDDVTLSYTRETDDNGRVHGVLHIAKTGLFNGDSSVRVVLSGSLTAPNPPAILGLSGLRSSRRDMVATTATMGTIFDGNNDGVEGGNATVYFGQYDISSSVPDYAWWYGCAPTSAGMIMAYYDANGFGDLIVGDPGDPDYIDNVHEAIASAGDGTYNLGTGPIVTDTPATPGTGHIGDYALYVTPGTDYLDSSDYPPATLIPDLSDPTVRNSTGVTPHADDCLADFMMTSWSNEGLRMGFSWPVYIGSGMTDYVDFISGGAYSSQYTLLDYGSGFNLGVLAGEIANNRPVLVGVDSSGSGTADHAAVAIGYDLLNEQYACYTTAGDGIHWYDFTAVGAVYGVDSGYLFEITDAA